MEHVIQKLQAGLAGRYEVQRELGQGGMAYVYLARDLRHDRDVAVKVLKPELAASLGAERFLREIRITAKLSHPHILPLYDSGEIDGLLFYVMPYIVGESLGDYLTREKQLSIEEAIRITREVAEALSHAHSFGLVHRDIKPENVMMTGGHAIVADFGISRAVSAAGGDKLTQTGMAVGTPAYMSPEQAAGDPDVDARSDIYSVGCMLYEMLIGQIPFTGPTAQAIMARHTMDHITPPHIMRDSIPQELEEVIYCTMAKVPADRFRTAHELVEALKTIETGGTPKLKLKRTAISPARARPAGWSWMPIAVGGGAAAVLLAGGWVLFGARAARPASIDLGPDPRTVAVLYFEDLSGSGRWQHVADGFTEGLIAKLSLVRGLNVISANGVRTYRLTGVPSDSIARDLEAGSLVRGTVEAAGGRLRVGIRLVEGGSGADFERAGFELAPEQLLEAQDSVIEGVARLLRRRLGEEVRLRDHRAGTSSVEAWSLLQQAQGLRKTAGAALSLADSAAARSSLARADSLLDLAERADPKWIDPVVGRGWVAHDRSLLERSVSAVPWLQAGVGHANRALALRPEDPKTLALRGTLRYAQYSLRATPDQREWERLLLDAKSDLEAAVRADPSLAAAQIALSHLYYENRTRDLSGALLAAQQGYEEDAYLEDADALLLRMFWGSLDLENFPQARRWCAEGARRFPRAREFVVCQLWLMVTPAIPDPSPDSAWALVARYDSLTPGDALTYQALENRILAGGVLGREGLADSARSVLAGVRAQTTARLDEHQDLLPREAYVRVLLGDFDEAIDLLKRYVAANPDHNFPATADRVWWWRELREHPRFAEISAGS